MLVPHYNIQCPDLVAARNHHYETAHIYPLPQGSVLVDMSTLTIAQLLFLIEDMDD